MSAGAGANVGSGASVDVDVGAAIIVTTRETLAELPAASVAV